MKVYNKKIWFVAGSQHLYGEETLKRVEQDALKMVAGLNDAEAISAQIQFKGVLTRPNEIQSFCEEASYAGECMGVITWMHTFSPAQMWVNGLKRLSKPLCHFHTQFNRDIPFDDIDMDYMNLHQSAHGGREFGFIVSRMGLNRKVVAGHWQDPESHKDIDLWIRATAAWEDAQGARFARFGDNMRHVAVTEGNKVGALMNFGYTVEGYALGDLVAEIDAVSLEDAKKLAARYREEYTLSENLLARPKVDEELNEAARVEIGMRNFLEKGNFKGFTTNFENLYGISHLPGLACQRLMADGYGFGAEGDWKTAALLRAMKVMDKGLEGGTSFMEDYTYHMDPDNAFCLGAHMLEVCPTIASKKPVLDIQPLAIGGKADPPRLLFTAPKGEAVAASLIDLGNRFRLIVSEVEVLDPLAELPKLPVACAMWKPLPSLKTSAEAWILAGGAHHTSFSLSLNTEHLRCFAEIAGIELIVIDEETEISSFQEKLRWNDLYFSMQGLR